MKASYSLRVLDASMDEHFQRLMAEGIATHLELPASAAAKALLLNKLVRQNVGPAALTGQFGTTWLEVSRLADMDHTTRVGGIAATLHALGKQLDLRAV